jgi:hypothetical protein
LVVMLCITQFRPTSGSSWFMNAVNEILTLPQSSWNSKYSLRSTAAAAINKALNQSSGEPTSDTKRSCLNEKHLDPQECRLEDLKDSALKDICGRMGIDVENDVLPYYTPHGAVIEHQDFVRAAHECLLAERDVRKMLKSNETIPEDLVEPDLDLMANMLSEILEQNPSVLKELVNNLKVHDPSFWKVVNSKADDDAEPITAEHFASILRKLSV